MRTKNSSHMHPAWSAAHLLGQMPTAGPERTCQAPREFVHPCLRSNHHRGRTACCDEQCRHRSSKPPGGSGLPFAFSRSNSRSSSALLFSWCNDAKALLSSCARVSLALYQATNRFPASVRTPATTASTRGSAARHRGALAALSLTRASSRRAANSSRFSACSSAARSALVDAFGSGICVPQQLSPIFIGKYCPVQVATALPIPRLRFNRASPSTERRERLKACAAGLHLPIDTRWFQCRRTRSSGGQRELRATQ